MVVNASNTVIENCSFENCNALGFGGGILLDSGAGNTTMKHVKMLKCSAVRGGAMYVNACSGLSLSGGFVLRENIASGNGGALYLESSSAIIDGRNGELNGNTARVSGGAMHSARSDVKLSGTISFVNNVVTLYTSSSAGGAFYSLSSSITVTSGSIVIFRGNSCVYGGGALALYSASKLQINGYVNFQGGWIVLCTELVCPICIDLASNQATSPRSTAGLSCWRFRTWSAAPNPQRCLSETRVESPTSWARSASSTTPLIPAAAQHLSGATCAWKARPPSKVGLL